MVSKLNKILFTSDLSHNVRPAFDFAAALACRQGASIVLLHVMEEQIPYTNVHVQGLLGEERWQQLRESRENEARQLLSGKLRQGVIIKEALGEFCRLAKEDLGEDDLRMDDILVTRGDVVEEILKTAADTKCDMIVMAHHVRSSLSEAVLGSTSRRVIRRSPIPVLVVPIHIDQA